VPVTYGHDTAHYTFDGKCISFPMMHYVDSLV
jgi:hypothetical protein